MLGQVWAWLQGPGAPVANLLQITVAVIAAWSAAYSWFRRRRRSDRARIARLEEDLSRRTEQLERSKTKEEQLEATCAEITDRLPETIVAKSQRELRDGNHGKAHDIVRDWLHLEGEDVARLLRAEVEWMVTHAVGEHHLAGMVVACAYAAAAAAIWPGDAEAAELEAELRKFCVSDSTGALPSFVTALAVMDNVDADQRLNARAVDQALELERQAGILQGRASFRVALLQVEHALGILCNELGAKASPSLRLQCERGGLLLGLGRYHEALADARAVTESYTTLLGPLHPNTLAGRHLQARVLGSLGRIAEALPIIEDVALKQAASPDLGPLHPDTLASRHLQAQVLHGLGQDTEALPIIEDVASKQSTSPDLGPLHPDTLASRHLQPRSRTAPPKHTGKPASAGAGARRSRPGRRSIADHRRRRLEAVYQPRSRTAPPKHTEKPESARGIALHARPRRRGVANHRRRRLKAGR